MVLGASRLAAARRGAVPELPPAIEVSCSQCGFLGAFFVVPGQPLEEARRKAADLRDKHRCEFGKAEIAEKG